ncbi:MAG TPA: leucine--tRNA ligase [Candidatus Paceibacterota bacterium]|nr:leucine--tRNA ligase [Candidatus Paceibacterota bacterium]
MKYDHVKIEKKWQKEWAKNNIYKTGSNQKKPKHYVLDMFPYPSGQGLHVGHPKGYIGTDIYSRYKRMNGFNVLHPMGWDAFGLPAENYAIKNKVHPEVAVKKNIKRYKEQLSILGFDYDWEREINTTDPEYYRWTQWIFLQLLKKGLAYESYEPINWCPSCQTGLANEDLEDGKCERCKSVVEKKPMRQWVLKITDYADRLLKDLDNLDWPESVKESQRNWIGRSEGAELEFSIKDREEKIRVFTTRPDTLFGATYVVLAPENPLIESLKEDIPNWKEVKKYLDKAKAASDIDRSAEGREKTGVCLEGVAAINPANQEELPIYVADYVLGSYGTGAVMAVPAHDERDYEFADAFDLPLKTVIQPLIVKTAGDDAVQPGKALEERSAVVCIVKHWSEDKYLCSRWKKNDWKGFVIGGIEQGEDIGQAGIREIQEETGYQDVGFLTGVTTVHSQFYHAVKKVNRFAHFQAAFFQLKNGKRKETAEEERELHDVVWLTAEEVENFLNREDMKLIWQAFRGNLLYEGNGILANSGAFSGQDSESAKQAITKAVSGKRVTKYKLREWVFSRQRYWGEPIPVIHCPHCGVVPVPEKDLPVTLPKVKSYAPTGTGESPLAAIKKWVNTTCPTCKGKAERETNTMPQWAGSSWYYLRYIDPKNKKALIDPKKEKYWQPVDVYVGGTEHATRHLIYARFWHKFLYDIKAVGTKEPFKLLKNQGLISGPDGRKMSKSLGNVVNPDDIVERFGADTFRLYEMFLGPFEQGNLWSTDNIVGSRRFIEKVWRLAEKVDSKKKADEPELEALVHKTIKKVSDDIERFSFNTAVSGLMILGNEFEKAESISRVNFGIFLQLLAPYAPHITEELWRWLGNKKSIHLEAWPRYSPAKAADSLVTVIVQVGGKVRGSIRVNSDSEEETVARKAQEAPEIGKWLEGQTVKKTVYVKNRLINFVV